MCHFLITEVYILANAYDYSRGIGNILDTTRRLHYVTFLRIVARIARIYFTFRFITEDRSNEESARAGTMSRTRVILRYCAPMDQRRGCCTARDACREVVSSRTMTSEMMELRDCAAFREVFNANGTGCPTLTHCLQKSGDLISRDVYCV